VNVDLRSMLADRADAVEPPQIDPLGVVVQGERLLRRRHRLAAAGAALAVVATIGATTVLVDPDREISPAPPVDVRPLTYGQGTVLHRGDQAFDTGLNFLSLDITDGGAALTTLDGRIWFSDGAEVVEIGSTLGGRVHPDGVSWSVLRPRDWVVSDSSGSLIAWLEYPDRDKARPELVVYDAARRAVVARQPFGLSPRDRDTPEVTGVAGGEVFVGVDPATRVEGSSMYRYTVPDGAWDQVDVASFHSALRAVPRVLVHGSSGLARDVLGNAGPNPHLSDYEILEIDGSVLAGIFNPHTGEEVDVRLPDSGINNDYYVWFGQWLDDERFSLLIGSEGDLLICTIDAGQCTVAIDRSTWSGSAPPPLVPGNGAAGAEYALGEAMNE
jgi:hypothetical protein